jgi:hypothetical protein
MPLLLVAGNLTSKHDQARAEAHYQHELAQAEEIRAIRDSQQSMHEKIDFIAEAMTQHIIDSGGTIPEVK